VSAVRGLDIGCISPARQHNTKLTKTYKNYQLYIQEYTMNLKIKSRY